MRSSQYICILVAVIIVAQAVASIGVTPPRIITDNVLKGTSIEQSVTLVDVQEGDKLSITLSGEGSEWISVSSENNFIVEHPKSEELVFTLNIPQKAPNGEYNVMAQVIATPDEKQEGQGNTASVISGIMVDIQFTITGEQVKQYIVRHITVPDIEVGMPITVVATIKNEGNIIVKPTKVEIDVKDKETRDIIFSDEAAFITTIDPFLVGESIAILKNTNLAEDLYFIDVRIYDEDKEIRKEENIPFDVFARGTLRTSGRLTKLFTQEEVKNLAKITGVLENTGDIPLHATFHAEIYTEGILIDILETEEQYIGEGQAQEFMLQYEPAKKGVHNVIGYATFSGKKTNQIEITFMAHPAKNFFSNLSGTTIALYAVIAFLIIYILTTKIRNKKKNHAA